MSERRGQPPEVVGETGRETRGLISEEAVEKVERGRGLSLSNDRRLGLGQGVVGEEAGTGRGGLGFVRRENSYTVSSSSKLTESSVSPLKQLA